MILIQIEMPDELNKKVAIESIKRDLNDKRIVIVQILEEYFKKRGDTNE